MREARAFPGRASLRLCATLSFLGAAFVGAPALAYDDQSTVTSVLGLMGVYSENDGEAIVYREHSKLVVPPDRQALPQPQARNEARPAAWPVEPGAGHGRISHAATRRSADESGSKGAGDNSGAAPAGARCVSSADGACLIMTDADDPVLGVKKARVGGNQKVTRVHLTEPPAGYRDPVNDGKLSTGEPSEKSGLASAGAYIGKILGFGE